ncbi:capping complex subunit for YIEGIA [Orenia metallireducens]|uniref:capping complex subunit for YIEGIA n=1 Tax=Orenia metallireducens TaxID=1413210 RepID=UPI003CCBBDEB
MLAYITLDKERILTGGVLTLLAKDKNEQQELTTDIAKAMKADIVELRCGDYIVIKA